MKRRTIRLTAQQDQELQALIDAGEFPNRSEAVRTAVRELLNDYDRDHDGQPTRLISDGGEDIAVPTADPNESEDLDIDVDALVAELEAVDDGGVADDG